MVILYSKTNCPACVSAAGFLGMRGLPFTTIKIDKDEDAKQFILARGFRTVPQIYNDATDIFVEGGWLGLKDMDDNEIQTILYGTKSVV